MRREHFVETKVEFIISKLSHHRRQMNSAAVSDSRFQRHGCQGAYLNFMARQSFNVENQQVPHRLERESVATGAQRVVTAARFQREITAAGARVLVVHGQTLARPFFELSNGDCLKRQGTRTETCQRCFTICLGDLACQIDYP